MKILQIHHSFPPSTYYGGPTWTTYCLCRALAWAKQEVRVLTTNADGPKNIAVRVNQWYTIEGMRVLFGRRRARTLFSGAIYFGRREDWEWADVVHFTGLFSLLLPIVAFRSTRYRKPLVISPRGSLIGAALKRHSRRKRLFLATVGRYGIGRAAVFHATSESEAEAVRGLAGSARVRVVPNGVEVPAVLPAREGTAGPYGLYLGRLHPYKRAERIIAGFAGATSRAGLGARGKGEEGRRGIGARVDGGGRLVAGGRPDAGGEWSLVIAGDGEAAYRQDLELVVAGAGLGRRVRFVGQVAGEEKARLLAGAEFVVLASYSENFGMSVAEALAHGTPSVVTKTAPWEGLDREGCGFWVEDSDEGLTDGMRRLMALAPEERRAMGARGRAWMARDFSWASVARQMVAVYEELVQEARPGSANGG